MLKHSEEAIRLIDSGLNEAIRWSVEFDLEGENSLFGSELDLDELRALSESLKDPEKIDLERWAYALAILNTYAKNTPRDIEIRIASVLLKLEKLKHPRPEDAGLN